MTQIGAVLICDDVRKEINGKEIIIGLYTGDILVNSVPFVLGLVVWIEYFPSHIGVNSLNVRLNYAGKTFISGTAVIDAQTITPHSVVLPNLILQGDVAGDLEIEMQEGEEWKLLKRKTVRQSDLDAAGLPVRPVVGIMPR